MRLLVHRLILKKLHLLFEGKVWAGSSVGRAAVLQTAGRRFDPCPAHSLTCVVFSVVVVFLFDQDREPCYKRISQWSRSSVG